MKKTTFVKGLATGDFNEPGESPREQPRIVEALDVLGKEVETVKLNITTLVSRLGMVSDIKPEDELWVLTPTPARQSVVRMEAWVHGIITEVEQCSFTLNRIIDSLHI